MRKAAPIRIGIADDHPVVRAGVVSMLGKEPDIRVVSEPGAGGQVERLMADAAPDVLVLDVNMPDLDADSAARYYGVSAAG
jgi:DNA-binding NarL/FixJ family response regulator